VAHYEITLVVDSARKLTVERKLRAAFGDEPAIYSVEKVTTPESRAERLREAEGLFGEAQSIVEDLQSEMEAWRESVPENLQNSIKAAEVDEAIGQLEQLHNEIEAIDFSSVCFPRMF
jgi:hypothetical protein